MIVENNYALESLDKSRSYEFLHLVFLPAKQNKLQRAKHVTYFISKHHDSIVSFTTDCSAYTLHDTDKKNVKTFKLKGAAENT